MNPFGTDRYDLDLMTAASEDPRGSGFGVINAFMLAFGDPLWMELIELRREDYPSVGSGRHLATHYRWKYTTWLRSLSKTPPVTGSPVAANIEVLWTQATTTTIPVGTIRVQYGPIARITEADWQGWQVFAEAGAVNCAPEVLDHLARGGYEPSGSWFQSSWSS